MTREFKVPVQAPSIIKDGGTSSQYLMADGSVVTFSAQGIQGTQGIQGIQGTQGLIGDDGFVAQAEPPTNTSLLWLDTDQPASSLNLGTTLSPGILQLTDSVSSTSTTTAVTPNAVKSVNDLRTPILKRQSQTYFSSPMVVSTAGFSIQHNRTYYSPIYIDQTTSVDRIAVRSGSTFSGSTEVRLGIYNNDQSTGLPSTVFLDAGTVSVTASATTYQITINESINAGFYWVVMAQQSTAPTIANYLSNSTGGSVNVLMQTSSIPAASQNMGYFQNSVTGAFATAGTLSSAQSMPFVYLRVA
jgi:hypothetical protein